jgi:hypothetical protein
MCSLEVDTGLLHLHLTLSNGEDTAAYQRAAADGLMPSSTQPIDALAEFLRQEAARQPAGAGMHQAEAAFRAGNAGRTAAATAMLTAGGDKEEQRLYEQFPVWLDQLVSQVTGRRVTLVIEPQAAFNLVVEDQMVTGMYLKDTATGTKQQFGWRRPGYASGAAAYQGLILEAMQRGVTDHDLLEYSAALEPYEAPRTTGSGARRSAGSSSQSAPARQQQPPPAQGAGCTSSNGREWFDGRSSDSQQYGGPTCRRSTAAAGGCCRRC